MMKRWTHIMVHHSAGRDGVDFEIDAFRDWHVAGRGWRDLGYHFVVEKAGERYRSIAGRMLHHEGAHCPGMNEKAVGVCLAGDFTEAPPPAGQLEEAARLVAGLCGALGVPVSSVVAHRDHRQTECPGRSFDLAVFRRLVLAKLEG